MGCLICLPLIPFVDHIIKVNTTERMTPVEPQDIITKDKVFLKTDAVVFYKVKTDETALSFRLNIRFNLTE